MNEQLKYAQELLDHVAEERKRPAGKAVKVSPGDHPLTMIIHLEDGGTQAVHGYFAVELKKRKT